MDNKIDWMAVTRVVLAVVFVLVFIAALAWLANQPELSVLEQLESASRIAIGLLVLSFAVGVGGMAVVQVWKNIGRARGSFHMERLEKLASELCDNVSVERDTASFDFPLEQLMAQLATEVEQALLHPLKSESLLTQVGGESAKAALSILKKLQENKDNNTSHDNNPDYIEALTLLRQAAEQGLDNLQNTIGNEWRFRVRLLAMIVAGLIGIAVLLLSDTGPAVKISVAITTVVWGGFFAWLVRDIAAGIERWRG